MSAVDPLSEPVAWKALLEAQPGAAFVIDALGTITLATEQAGRLVERDASELVGTSVLDHVDPDAVWSYAAAMDFATAGAFADVPSGPVRVTIRTASGGWVAADLWTTNRLEDPDLAGVVCVLAPPSAALGLADAVTQVAAGDPFAEVAAAVAGSLEGFPIIGQSAVLELVGDRFEVAAVHGLARSLVDGTCGDELWRAALDGGGRVARAGSAALPGRLVDVAVAAGFESVWVEPVSVVGGRPGETTGDVLVVFRRLCAEPTPNELSYLHRAAAVLGLARLRSTGR